MDDSRYIDADDYYDIACEWLKLKNYENAETHFKKVIDLNPRFIYAYIDLSAVYAALKKYREAVSVLKKAVEYDPGFDRLYYLMAKYSYRENDFKRAIGAIEKAISLNPSRLYDRARLLFEKRYRGKR